MRVEDAHGAPPSVPFWHGEAPGRTVELSDEVARLRERSRSHRRAKPCRARDPCARADCGLDRLGAEQAVAYVAAGRAVLGAVPTTTTVVAERFFDEGGGMQLVIHAPFGSRINRAWGLALRKRFCRSFNFELQAAATDNGIDISLSEQHAFPLEVVFEISQGGQRGRRSDAGHAAAPMFTARWRWNAQRALGAPALPRRPQGPAAHPAHARRRSARGGVSRSGRVRGESDRRGSAFPIIRWSTRPSTTACTRRWTWRGSSACCGACEAASIATVAIDTAEPSPFSHEILNANPYAYLDDAPLEERRARAVQLRNSLRADVTAGAGALDQEAVRAVRAESWPVVRSADELHDALLTLIQLPPAEADAQWHAYFEALVAANRASIQSCGELAFWVPAEKLDVFAAAHDKTVHAQSAPDPEVAVAEIVRGWMESIGPTGAGALAQRLGLPGPAVEAALVRLETQGQVLRGSFTPGVVGEWCNRRVLARIHRRTVSGLRRGIEPVSTARYERFLAQWHHLAPGTALHGVEGTLQIVKQLQGLEFPASTWESDVLPRRVAQYKSEYLDALCASGEVMWGRLSPHPAFESGSAARSRRVRPTRVAPVALFLRQDAEWLLARRRDGRATNEDAGLSSAALDVRRAISDRGASFFADIVRTTGRLASEVEDGLWELVAAGSVTADGFDNLRALIDPKRRLALGRHNLSRPRHAIGRWALLRQDAGVRARDAAPASATAHDADLEAYAHQLLTRWGIVFRDVVLQETQAPPWRDLLVTLRRLELQGVIRGGRFVARYVGEQFCRPEALECLRATRDEAA